MIQKNTEIQLYCTDKVSDKTNEDDARATPCSVAVPLLLQCHVHGTVRLTHYKVSSFNDF